MRIKGDNVDNSLNIVPWHMLNIQQMLAVKKYLLHYSIIIRVCEGIVIYRIILYSPKNSNSEECKKSINTLETQRIKLRAWVS